MSQQKLTHGSIFSYTIGLVLSIVFTLLAYYVVVEKVFTQNTTVITGFVGLAIAQLLVQLFFFLHLGKESKPRWNLMTFSFMLLVVGIVVIGSLWIMHNLDYHMMPEHEVDQHMMHERDKGF
jgi:cytochrome o ubiquinol oxidase operon protein cyoD